MNKKGFTLVELLAVIAILAILAIMALPNVLRLLNNARKESFTTEVRTIVGSAEKQWLSDQITNPKSEITYARVNGNKCDDNPMLDLSGNKNLNYKVTVENGKVKCIQLDNGKYSYTLTSNDGIDTSQIENSKVTDVNENNKVTCEDACGISGGDNQISNKITVKNESIDEEYFSYRIKVYKNIEGYDSYSTTFDSANHYDPFDILFSTSINSTFLRLSKWNIKSIRFMIGNFGKNGFRLIYVADEKSYPIKYINKKYYDSDTNEEIDLTKEFIKNNNIFIDPIMLDTYNSWYSYPSGAIAINVSDISEILDEFYSKNVYYVSKSGKEYKITKNLVYEESVIPFSDGSIVQGNLNALYYSGVIETQDDLSSELEVISDFEYFNLVSQLGDEIYEGTYGFQLKNGETICINSIPQGYTYKIEQLEKNGYKLVEINNQSVTQSSVIDTMGNNERTYIFKSVKD